MAEFDGVAAVVKASLLLGAFGPSTPTLSVRQLAEHTGIPRSTAHVLCRTLVDVGLLEVADTGYRLGPMLLELGGQVIERTGLVRAAEGVLEGLTRARTSESHLGQLTQGWIVYLDRQASGGLTAMRNRVGQREPAHVTGCGKAALSLLGEDEVRELITATCALARRPAPDLEATMAELAEVRRAGYAVSTTFQLHRTSIAAPIVDAGGSPVGGISLAAPNEVFTSSFRQLAQERVTEAASAVSARLAAAG